MGKSWKELKDNWLYIKHGYGVVGRLFGIPFLLFGTFLIAMFLWGTYQAVTMGGLADRILALTIVLLLGVLFAFPGVYMSLRSQKTFIGRRQQRITQVQDFILYRKQRRYQVETFDSVELKYEYKQLKRPWDTSRAGLRRKTHADVFSLFLIPPTGDGLFITADNYKEPMVKLGQVVSEYTGLKFVDHTGFAETEPREAESAS